MCTSFGKAKPCFIIQDCRTKLVKTADQQAYREALCACRSAVFTSFVRQVLYDEAGLCFTKRRTHFKIGDTRFLPDSDDILVIMLRGKR